MILRMHIQCTQHNKTKQGRFLSWLPYIFLVGVLWFSCNFLCRDLDSLDIGSPSSGTGVSAQHIPNQFPQGEVIFHSKALIILAYPTSVFL
jgi:hypothetical protein